MMMLNLLILLKMNNPAKTAKIPVESHGLHMHKSNVPRIFTANFYEHLPVYCFDFEKKNRIKYFYSFFNRLNALPVPALVTGQTRIYGFYVPYESIFKGWYDFHARTTHNFSDGSSATLTTARYVKMSDLNHEFVNNVDLASVASSSDYDIQYLNSDNTLSFYKFTSFGAAVYKIFCALGLPLSWYDSDPLEPNCLKVLGYLRVMYDHFFPLQYVGNQQSQNLMNLFNDDTLAGLMVSAQTLLDLVGHVLYGWFDTNWIESAWDNPVGPNGGNGIGSITVNDATNDATNPQIVTTNPSAAQSPSNLSNKPSAGVPFVGGSSSGVPTATGVLTQFVIDALQSVNNFIKRRGLSGNRLIENYLTQHGVALPSGIYHESLKLDQYSIPFEIESVESNSDLGLDSNGQLVNKALGELGGKGSTSGSKLKFNHSFDRPGLFYIMQVAVPDSEPLLAFDPYNLCKSPLDFHHSAFEKLGVETVPSRILYQDNIGNNNKNINLQDWGFFKRYFYGNVDIPLEFGDFRVPSRGSQSLAQYHTFRRLYPYFSHNNWNLAHSYDFLRVGNDSAQFSRIFYTDKVDVMTVVGRVRGRRWTGFLPFGDSYDWDDDEMNQKVVVQNVGNNAQ